jgi:E3 ubiquitin-protein ligase HERC4
MLIESLTPSVIDEMFQPGPDETLDQDFLEKLETIFQSPAGLNASLLLPSHKPCTSKNNGIDFSAWTRSTQTISQCKNETIRDLVSTGLTKFVLPKLEMTPPDVETLRQFVTLPLFSEFSDESLYKEVHCQYSKGRDKKH